MLAEITVMAAEELRRENMRSAKAFLQRYEKYVL
jgi:hypothetical protein